MVKVKIYSMKLKVYLFLLISNKYTWPWWSPATKQSPWPSNDVCRKRIFLPGCDNAPAWLLVTVTSILWRKSRQLSIHPWNKSIHPWNNLHKNSLALWPKLPCLLLCSKSCPTNYSLPVQILQWASEVCPWSIFDKDWYVHDKFNLQIYMKCQNKNLKAHGG